MRQWLLQHRDFWWVRAGAVVAWCLAMGVVYAVLCMLPFGVPEREWIVRCVVAGMFGAVLHAGGVIVVIVLGGWEFWFSFLIWAAIYLVLCVLGHALSMTVLMAFSPVLMMINPALLAVASVPVGGVVVAGLRAAERRDRERERTENLCGKCGYSRRGLRIGSACPECGDSNGA